MASTVTTLADQFHHAWAELHPEEGPWLLGTGEGQPLTSPESDAERLALIQATARALRGINSIDEDERLTAAVLSERLAARGALLEAGERTHLARATDPDARRGVGRDRYALYSRWALGDDTDLEDAYAWAWAEFENIEHSLPPIREAVAVAMADEEDTIIGPDAFVAWGRRIWQLAAASVQTAVPLPELVDGERTMYAPGRVEMPFRRGRRFPRWAYVATLLHEGIPGHHLQETLARESSTIASTWRRRLATYLAGYSEGWATFAERTVDLDHPSHRFGIQASWLTRLTRAICDIGLHCDLRAPTGGRWTFDRAIALYTDRLAWSGDVAVIEVERILASPAECSSYALGARVWAEVQDPLTTLHHGPMGLGLLRTYRPVDV